MQISQCRSSQQDDPSQCKIFNTNICLACLRNSKVAVVWSEGREREREVKDGVKVVADYGGHGSFGSGSHHKCSDIYS